MYNFFKNISIIDRIISLFKKPLVHHGNHVFGDFIWNSNVEKINDKVLADFIFQKMKESVNNLTNMTIVHSKLCILGEGTSPPGFTSIVLIDESHISSHCYSDRGWLAIDVFTCGHTDPQKLMNYITNEIGKEYPTFKCTYVKKHHRFHHLK